MTRRPARKRKDGRQLDQLVLIVQRCGVEALVLILLLIEAYKIIDGEVQLGRVLWR